jgi:tetratricopeptide (TPR) repeat protein
MKAERRHELQHNEVADWVAATIERVKPYSRAIVAVAVAATVLLVAYVVLSGRSERKQSVAWNDYYQAVQAESKDVATDLESVVREHGGVPAGLWAEVALGDLKLGEGIESLFREKQAAQSKLRGAIQHYQNVLEEADDAMLVARARFGLARAYESLGQLGEARDAYKQIVGSSGTNAYISIAKERLKDLDRSETKDFYAWFGKQEPVAAPPASSLLPGTPGERLPFEPGSLGSPGGLNPSGSSFLDLPPLDKGTTGPLLTPQDKPAEKDDKGATEKGKNEESDKDEKKEAGKEGGGKEETGDAASVEDKAAKEAETKEESTKDEKNAAGSGEKSSEKSADKADDDKADK